MHVRICQPTSAELHEDVAKSYKNDDSFLIELACQAFEAEMEEVSKHE